MTTADSSRTSSRREFLATAAAALAAPAVLAQRLDALAPAPELSLQPLLARPTTSSIFISARNGPADATATVRLQEAGANDAVPDSAPLHAAPGTWLEWSVDGLKPGTRYTYAIHMMSAGHRDVVVARGGFTTQRTGSESFVAALITDPHTGSFREGAPELRVMDDVVSNVRRDNPEFVIGLGDNVAWPSSRDAAQTSSADAERAYEMYRRHTAPLTAFTPHFSLLGNWEGETGKFPLESIALVRGVRHRFLPNPDHPDVSAGGEREAGLLRVHVGTGALCHPETCRATRRRPPRRRCRRRPTFRRLKTGRWVAPSCHGLESTLKASSQPFKFLCIHHAVGGNAGDPQDTLYGRGGARAA